MKHIKIIISLLLFCNLNIIATDALRAPRKYFSPSGKEYSIAQVEFALKIRDLGHKETPESDYNLLQAINKLSKEEVNEPIQIQFSYVNDFMAGICHEGVIPGERLPIKWALIARKLGALEALVEKGADIKTVDSKGRSTLDLACARVGKSKLLYQKTYKNQYDQNLACFQFLVWNGVRRYFVTAAVVTSKQYWDKK